MQITIRLNIWGSSVMMLTGTKKITRINTIQAIASPKLSSTL
jgi:hypothetical protein